MIFLPALLCFLISFVPILCSLSHAAVHLVPQQHTTIQAAIDSAGQDDTVLVNDGTYSGPGNYDLEFHGKRIVLRSVNGPEHTVIDCQGLGRGIWLHDDDHDARVEGLQIRNGAATYGGGIAADSAYVHLTNCWIHSCTAADGGGAISADRSGVIMDGCRLFGNQAGYGGAVYVISGYIFAVKTIATGNRAVFGSGRRGKGGAFYVHRSGVPEFWYSTIAGNHAEDRGGAFYLESGEKIEPDVTVRHSIISNNSAMGGCPEVANWGSFFEASCSLIDTSTYFACEIDGANSTAWEIVEDDPLFCDPVPPTSAPTTAGDYAISPGSPALVSQTAQTCSTWAEQASWPYTFIGHGDTSCAIITSVDGQGPIKDRALLSPLPSIVRMNQPVAIRNAVGEPLSAELLNVAGRRISSFTIGPAEAHWSPSESGVGSAGVYFLLVKQDARSEVHRILVLR